MLRISLIVLLALIPASALAGTRATYAGGESGPMVIEIADNGDISANITESSRLLVLANHAFIVEERLTGPLVTRLEDLAALMPPSTDPQAAISTSVPSIAARLAVGAGGPHHDPPGEEASASVPKT